MSEGTRCGGEGMTELDRWLAENLMGWVVDDYYGEEIWTEPYTEDHGQGALEYLPQPVMPTKDWHPTTNITHTQIVWGKIRDKRYRIVMFLRKHPDLWTCHIMKKGLSSIIAKASDSVIEMAVCRAVKATIEAEMEAEQPLRVLRDGPPPCEEPCEMCQQIQADGNGCCMCGNTSGCGDHSYTEMYDEKCDSNHGDNGFHICISHRQDQELEENES
jgi:hypothetical protein